MVWFLLPPNGHELMECRSRIGKPFPLCRSSANRLHPLVHGGQQVGGPCSAWRHDGERGTLLGDGSPKQLVNLGDVVLIDVGEGVFTGREPHTSHQSNETLQCNRCCCSNWRLPVGTSCSSKPTLDRSIIEGYNQCLSENEKAVGEYKAANIARNGYASGLIGLTISNCKDKYGIPPHGDITDHRIIN